MRRQSKPASDAGDDVCDYPLARNLVTLTVAVACEVVLAFLIDGVERSYNASLTGTTPTQELTDLTNILTGTDQVGNVVLSIDHRMQERARAELGDRRGSVVALDPASGAIRAFWSNPSFDPNPLALNDGSVANEAWTELNETDGNPLRPSMYKDRYFPGSTFKVITAASGLDNGLECG